MTTNNKRTKDAKFVIGGTISMQVHGRFIRICRTGDTDAFVLIDAKRLSAVGHARLVVEALNKSFDVEPLGSVNQHDTLVAQIESLRRALEAVQNAAEDSQGEFSGITRFYSPEWTHGYKEISEIASEILRETERE